jgi:hypothetical protein
VTIRLQGGNRQPLAIALALGLILSGCAKSGRKATPEPRHSMASPSLPAYSAAAELKPCESVSVRQLSSIIGRPVHIDKIGNVGERPILSQGAVLPRIWLATCNWVVPSYSTLAPYLQIELTPSSASALTEFNGLRTKMGLTEQPAHISGYGQEAVFDIDAHGDVIIVIRKDAKVITIELTATSRNAPSPLERMRMAKLITKIVMMKE